MSPPEAAGTRGLVLLAAAMGLATVLLAALGSHAVELPDQRAVGLWQTGAAMLGLHALAVLAIASLGQGLATRLLPAAALLMGAGSLLFSSTLMLRAGGVAMLPAAVPPTGGLLLMAGWVCVGLAAVRGRRR